MSRLFALSINPAMQLFRPQIADAIFMLGTMLENGRSLIEALEAMAFSSRNFRLRDAAFKAADMLKQGNSPETVFRNNEFFVFPPYVRYILACPLDDSIKGRILSSWNREGASHSTDLQSFYYPLQTLVVGMLSSMAIFLFVLPQFKEIMHGLQVQPDPVLKFFFSLDLNFTLVGLSAVGLIAILTIFIKWLIGMKKYGDYVNLLSVLSAVPLEDRSKVLSVLGSRVLFPSQYRSIKTFSGLLESGKTVNDSCELARFPVVLRWFLVMGFESENSTEMLKDGSFLLANAYQGKRKISVNIIEIFCILLMGICFGTLIYAVFSGITQLMQGAIL